MEDVPQDYALWVIYILSSKKNDQKSVLDGPVLAPMITFIELQFGII